MNQFRFVVEDVRTFSDGGNIKRYFVKTPVKNLPVDLPTDVNARAQNLRTGVARSIRRSLQEQEDIFHLLNRGIVITAKQVQFDNQTRELSITLGDPALYGILDGGHSYKVIIDEMQRHDSDAYVTLEILTGVEEYQADIVESRNTSMQVEATALANVRQEFDPILDWLDSHGIPKKRIRVKQFDSEADIPMLDILRIMYLFDVETFGNDIKLGFNNPPLRAYSAKGTVLKHFEDMKHRDVFTRKILPLLPDILWIWDFVALRSQVHYRQGTGKVDGRFGGRRGNDAGPLPGMFMSNINIPVAVNPAYRLPLIAAMRCLVDDCGSQYGWTDIPDSMKQRDYSEIERVIGRPLTVAEMFYENVAPQMLAQIDGEIENSTPNKIGKSAVVWNQLFVTAWSQKK